MSMGPDICGCLLPDPREVYIGGGVIGRTCMVCGDLVPENDFRLNQMPPEMSELLLTKPEPAPLSDSEKLRLLREASVRVKRGCDCEYDYRCGRCEVVLNLQQVLERIGS